MDGADDARLGGIFFDAFAKLRDVLVESTAFGEVIHAPDFVGEGVAVDDLATAFLEQAQDFDIAWAEGEFDLVAIGAQLGGDDAEVVHGEVVVGFAIAA